MMLVDVSPSFPRTRESSGVRALGRTVTTLGPRVRGDDECERDACPMDTPC